MLTEEQNNSNNEENHLVELAKNGNSSAFETLYQNSVGRVYSVCLRISSDPVLAEELTQDTFVKAWQNLKTFRLESSFNTWLHRIAVNTVLAYLRKKKRRVIKFSYINELLNFNEKLKITPGEKIDIEKAISLLPEKARTVFVLHDVEGYKHEEISEMMNTKIGTSKAQLHRARKLLRESLVK